MELRQLRYAVALSEHGNFSRAAEACHVVQPALSQQIAKLERELGVTLFERTSRSVEITAAGRALVETARTIVSSVDELPTQVSHAAGEMRGRLTIGVISLLPDVDIPALVAEFHRDHPLVDLTLRWGLAVDLVAHVSSGQLGLAFLGVDPARPALPGLSVHRLGSERFVLLARHDDPLAGTGGEVRLEEMAERTFVDFPPGSGMRSQNDQAFARLGVPRRVAFEVDNLDTLSDLVAEGLGLAMIPDSVGPSAALRAALLVVPLARGPVRDLVVITKPVPSPPVAAFVERVLAALLRR